MSVLRPGDECLHYCDGSHRWVVSPRATWSEKECVEGQRLWELRVRGHVELHDREPNTPNGLVGGNLDNRPPGRLT